MPQRTIVYVDGFNLYYGSLRKTNYKWLDLKALFANLLGSRHHITEIKYYTAAISDRGGNAGARQRQKLYLLALKTHIPELSIHYGHYLTHQIKAKVCNPTQGQPPYVTVFKTEEKGSDVNLALHLLNDAWLDKYDCAVLVSNDSDLAEAMRLVKAQHNKTIGLIVPGDEKIRKPSRELAQHATFIKRIRRPILEASQLPQQIPNSTLYKPDAWQK